MGKIAKFIGLMTIAFLLFGCQSTEESSTSQSVEEPQKTGDHAESDEMTDTGDENAGDVQDEKTDSSKGDETTSDEIYSGARVTTMYVIYTHVLEYENNFYTAYSIDREQEEDQALSPEQRLEKSLSASDPTEQGILDSYADLTWEWPDLTIQFSQEGNELATTTAQSTLFFDTLFGVSDLFGIEEVIFLNADGEKDVTVAERTIDEAVTVKDERGLTRGYYAIYNKELESTLFIPGGALDEQVTNENNEPLSFPETIEKMASVNDDSFYSSAISEGIEVTEASIQNGVATVRYTMDEELVTDADRTVFENAIQLAALDFHAWEVTAINGTLKESVTYLLVGQ